MGIVAKVYDTGGSTLLGTLSSSFARQWREARADPGSGGLTVPARGADAALIVSDRIIRFELDGTVRFAIVIGQRDRNSISTGEEASENTTVNGLGVLSLLSNAVVYPELGVGRLSPSERYFDFASTSFDDSGWASAVEIKLQSDHSGSGVGLQWRTADDHSAPSSWPDPTAWWIWSRAQSGSTPPQPVGTSYFRKTFTLAGQTPVAILVTADDGFELYLDGGLVAQETTAFMWNSTRRIDVLLDAGTHTLAIKGVNITRASASTNVAGVLCTVMESDQGGSSFGAVIVNTDNTWKTADYPSPAPTMTPGQILKVLIDEAQTRGTLGGVSYDFTNADDSHGNAWATPIDVSYAVGASYLDVLKNLLDIAVDASMDPETLTLHVYNKGTMGTSPAVTLEAGVNFTSLVHQIDPPVARDALVQYHTGIWAEVASGDTPRKEFALQLGGAPSDDQVTRGVQAVFDTSAADKVYLTWGCIPVTGAAPYVDWTVCDTITAPDESDSPVSVVVTALIISEMSPAQDGTVNGSTLYAAEAELA